jgi:hypothetical protein
MSAERKRKVGWLKLGFRGKAGVQFFWQVLGRVDLPRDLLDREPLFRHTLDAEPAIGKIQIVRIDFQ